MSVAAAQTQSNRPDRRVQLEVETPAITERDIVVTGIRLIKGKPPIPARPGSYDDWRGRSFYVRSELFARCADKPILSLLRRVVDSPPQSSDQAFALDLLVRTNIGCYPDFPRPTRAPPALGDCAVERSIQSFGAASGDLQNVAAVGRCRARFTRAAVLERVIETYASDFRLTREQTWRNDVRHRFNMREGERNRLRDRRDRRYFMVASCLVQAQPELATYLLRAPVRGSLAQRIQQTMYARSPDCVGYADSVRADPAEFRTYIVDAIYRWIVAAKDVETLLPV